MITSSRTSVHLWNKTSFKKICVGKELFLSTKNLRNSIDISVLCKNTPLSCNIGLKSLSGYLISFVPALWCIYSKTFWVYSFIPWAFFWHFYHVYHYFWNCSHVIPLQRGMIFTKLSYLRIISLPVYLRMYVTQVLDFVWGFVDVALKLFPKVLNF